MSSVDWGQLMGFWQWIRHEPMLILLFFPELMVLITMWQRPRSALWFAIVGVLLSTAGWYAVWWSQTYLKTHQSMTPGEMLAGFLVLFLTVFGGFFFSVCSGFAMMIVAQRKHWDEEAAARAAAKQEGLLLG